MSAIYFSYFQSTPELTPGTPQGLGPPAELLLLLSWDLFLAFSRYLPEQETPQPVQLYFCQGNKLLHNSQVLATHLSKPRLSAPGAASGVSPVAQFATTAVL